MISSALTIRLAFTDRNEDGKVELLGSASEITQQNDFYPFGMAHKGEGLFHGDLGGNRYRYNGKEFNEDIGLYDYGARWYDPAIGRWGAVDPLAEQFAAHSPYHYSYNNPIRFIDPDGRSADDVILTGDAAKDFFSQLQAKTTTELAFNEESGEVTVASDFTGPVPGDEGELLKAISDESVTVNLNATFAKTHKNGGAILGGVFEGSTVESDGHVNASQTVNPFQLKRLDSFVDDPLGTSALHEVAESYLGAVHAPGTTNPSPEFDLLHTYTNLIGNRSKFQRGQDTPLPDTYNAHRGTITIVSKVNGKLFDKHPNVLTTTNIKMEK